MLKGLKTLLFLGSIVAFSIAFVDSAQAAKRLTEDMVRGFIEETTTLTDIQNENFDPDTVKTYLERHLHKNARFKSTMSYSIPGHDKQENSISLDKEKYIASITDSPKAVGGYDREIEILDIRISKDGGNATVTTKSTESGYINVSAEQQVPMEGVSTCNQIIVMSKKNVIQMYSAQCTTEVEFTDTEL